MAFDQPIPDDEATTPVVGETLLGETHYEDMFAEVDDDPDVTPLVAPAAVDEASSQWVILTEQQVAELEAVVKRIGFSWVAVWERCGSTMAEMTSIRNRRRPFCWEIWYPHLLALADAVESVPIPAKPAAYVPKPREMFEGATPAMPLAQISQTIGRLFLEAEQFAPGEKESMQDAYGRVAEALGLTNDVLKEIRRQQRMDPVARLTAPIEPPRQAGTMAA